MKNQNIINSFNHAISGIIYGIKTQRNLKIHCAAAVVVLLLSLLCNFTTIEILIILFTIIMVIVTEMVNTAIENVVDIVSQSYHPLAKVAKDVAAGAVLIASVNAIVVAYILFLNKPAIINLLMNVFIIVGQPPLHILFLSVLIVLILTFLIKTGIIGSTKMDEQRLFKIACKAKEKAYAPYSNFKVGAALLTKSGKVFTGCNVENATYGATCCAERTAIYKAVSEGEIGFEAIAVDGDNDGLTFPCGICRQVIAEFAPEIKVVLGDKDFNTKVFVLQDLLPHAFYKEDNT